MVETAKHALDCDKLLHAERVIDHIHEIDGEIRGLEETP